MESFKWRFTSNLTGDTDVIRSGGRVSIHSSGQRLVISDLQVDDSGVWSCVAFNELTEDVVNSKELVVEGEQLSSPTVCGALTVNKCAIISTPTHTHTHTHSLPSDSSAALLSCGESRHLTHTHMSRGFTA